MKYILMIGANTSNYLQRWKIDKTKMKDESEEEASLTEIIMC